MGVDYFYGVDVKEDIHYTLLKESITQYTWGVLVDDIKDWLRENNIDELDTHLIVLETTQQGELYFLDEEDAMAFKLRWL